jgi:uncharacterized lipoprotein YbaY
MIGVEQLTLGREEVAGHTMRIAVHARTRRKDGLLNTADEHAQHNSTGQTHNTT